MMALWLNRYSTWLCMSATVLVVCCLSGCRDSSAPDDGRAALGKRERTLVAVLEARNPSGEVLSSIAGSIEADADVARWTYYTAIEVMERVYAANAEIGLDAEEALVDMEPDSWRPEYHILVRRGADPVAAGVRLSAVDGVLRVQGDSFTAEGGAVTISLEDD